MDKEEAIDILESFIDHEKYTGFYSNATREEVKAMEITIKYKIEN